MYQTSRTDWINSVLGINELIYNLQIVLEPMMEFVMRTVGNAWNLCITFRMYKQGHKNVKVFTALGLSVTLRC